MSPWHRLRHTDTPCWFDVAVPGLEEIEDPAGPPATDSPQEGPGPSRPHKPVEAGSTPAPATTEEPDEE